MVTYEDIVRAKDVITPHIIRTPLVYSPTFSEMTGANVYLKLETLQKAGSFKVRGASYRILSHKGEIGAGGVIAASAGNHAQGVAVAACIAGVHATIVMPVHASISKQSAAKRYGADIILKGEDLQESIEIASSLSSDGRVFIHPYNDPDIIAGQGTIGLEILEDLQSVDIVIAPVGGGGLISGIAIAMKARNPEIRIVGVQSSACPSAYNAMLSGENMTVIPEQSVADGIMVPQVGSLTLPILQSLVDEIVLVPEDEIADAMLLLLERKKILAEGAGAVPVAALFHDHIPIQAGSNVVLVISGGNVDIPLFTKIINRGLQRKGRIMHISIRLRDVPGSLAGLLVLIARCGGNIIHIEHCKDDPDLPPDVIIAAIEIETRGPDHVREIKRTILEGGYLPG